MPKISLVRSLVRSARAHAYITSLIALVFLGGGYWEYKRLTSTSGETRYVLGTVATGTIVSAISASGQVSAANQIDVKPKVSGEITQVFVKSGDVVRAGAPIVQIDSREAEKAVRDAQVNLESAKLALQKLTQPADELSMTQARNALAQASSTLAKAYDDGFTDVSNAFLDLPSIMTGLDTVLHGMTVNKTQDNASAYTDLVKDNDPTVIKYRDAAITKYNATRDEYNTTFNEYKAASRFSDTATIERLVSDSYRTTKAVADAAKAANDFLNFVSDNLTTRHQTVPSLLTTHLTSLGSYIGQTNTHVASLLGITDTITNTRQSIDEKTQSLEKLTNGADALDVQGDKLAITQRENALQDAEDKLADYTVRAPFDGTIASVSAKKGDSALSAALATIITKQQIAQLSLNEVDAAKIKLDDKATLTFDAIDGLTLTGSVSEIDTVGTVAQGVVSYAVKIQFDSQDERVKPGMTVNSAIQTAVHQNVLTVPSSAVKTQSGSSYVLAFDPPLTNTGGSQGVTSKTAPRQVSVQTGISDDTNVEILSGLSGGEQIVIRTLTGAVNTAATPTANNRGGGGFGGGIRLGG